MLDQNDCVEAIIFDVVDKFGEKIVHILADSYNSYDDTETPYRFVEYCFAYIPLADIIRDGIWEYDLSQHKQYIEYCSLNKLNEIYTQYHKYVGNPTMIFGEVPQDIPTGSYILFKEDFT